jgi:MFS family permease
VTRGLPTVEEERQPWGERLRAGLAFARSTPTVRTLFLGEAVALVLFTLVVPIEVVYAKVSLHTSDAGFGVLLAAWGAGIVVGSLLYVAVKGRSMLLLILASTAAVGAAYAGMAAAGTLLVASAFSVLGGAGNGVQWIAVITALQEATPRRLQARVSGLLESLGAAMPGAGYLIGGVLAAVGSPRTAYAVAGIGVLALVLAAATVGRRWLALDGGAPSRARNGGNGGNGGVPPVEPFARAADLEPTGEPRG